MIPAARRGDRRSGMGTVGRGQKPTGDPSMALKNKITALISFYNFYLHSLPMKNSTRDKLMKKLKKTLRNNPELVDVLYISLHNRPDLVIDFFKSFSYKVLSRNGRSPKVVKNIVRKNATFLEIITSPKMS